MAGCLVAEAVSGVVEEHLAREPTAEMVAVAED